MLLAAHQRIAVFSNLATPEWIARIATAISICVGLCIILALLLDRAREEKLADLVFGSGVALWCGLGAALLYLVATVVLQ